MNIQRRIPNPAPLYWIGLAVLAAGGGALWYVLSRKENEDAATAEESEIIPPSEWIDDPNLGANLNQVTVGQLYKAVFVTARTADDEVPAYAIEHVPAGSITVVNVTYRKMDMDGVPAAEGTITFRPKTPGSALIRVEAPGVYRQLALEISE